MSACTVCTEPLDDVLTVAGFDTHPICKPAAKPADNDLLRRELVEAITVHAAQAPRSQQKAIGPSEIGHPCARRIAYKLYDWPTTNDDSDPLPSVVGTGAHAWMAEAMSHPRHRGRYLVETRVDIRAPIGGSCDLFDIITGTVVDWKFPGQSGMANYRNNGPSDVYRKQVHLYGYGFEQLGLTVNTVAIAFLPRGGNLRGRHGIHVWSQPYDRQVALDALDRLDGIQELLWALEPEHDAARWEAIPATPTYCAWCPWFAPGSTDLSTGCPGDSLTRADNPSAQSITSLIA